MKLLILNESGSCKPLVDLDNKSVENIELYNLDVYVYSPKEVITVIDKYNNYHEVKAGQTILKSQCKDIFEITDSVEISNLIEKLIEKKKQREIDNNVCIATHISCESST